MTLDITGVVVSLIVLAVITVVLNSVCIYIIRTSKSLRQKPSSFLVLNLLTVHVIQGLFVFPFYAAKKLKVSNLFWARFFANGWRFTYMLTFYGTCLAVLFISGDRFLATYWLSYYKPRVTKRRVKITLIALWMYLISLCLIPFIPEESNNVSIASNSTSNKTSRPKYYFYNQQNEWVLFMLSFNTAIPYVLIVTCYAYIIHRLKGIEVNKPSVRARSRATSAVEMLGNNREMLVFRKRDIEKYKQVTRLTLVLAVAYALFWSPSTIYYPLKDMCKECFPEHYENSTLEKHIGFIIKYIAFLDAVAAPLIYCFYHAEFRFALARLRSKIFHTPESETVLGDTTELT